MSTTSWSDVEKRIQRKPNPHILLIGTNKFKYNVIKLLMESRGVMVDYVATGKAGWETYRKAPAHTYDAVLAEYTMPWIGGKEIASYIRAEEKSSSSTTPRQLLFAILNSNQQSATVLQAIASGFDYGFYTPFCRAYTTICRALTPQSDFSPALGPYRQIVKLYTANAGKIEEMTRQVVRNLERARRRAEYADQEPMYVPSMNLDNRTEEEMDDGGPILWDRVERNLEDIRTTNQGLMEENSILQTKLAAYRAREKMSYRYFERIANLTIKLRESEGNLRVLRGQYEQRVKDLLRLRGGATSEGRNSSNATAFNERDLRMEVQSLQTENAQLRDDIMAFVDLLSKDVTYYEDAKLLHLDVTRWKTRAGRAAQKKKAYQRTLQSMETNNLRQHDTYESSPQLGLGARRRSASVARITNVPPSSDPLSISAILTTSASTATWSLDETNMDRIAGIAKLAPTWMQRSIENVFGVVTDASESFQKAFTKAMGHSGIDAHSATCATAHFTDESQVVATNTFEKLCQVLNSLCADAKKNTSSSTLRRASFVMEGLDDNVNHSQKELIEKSFHMEEVQSAFSETEPNSPIDTQDEGDKWGEGDGTKKSTTKKKKKSVSSAGVTRKTPKPPEAEPPKKTPKPPPPFTSLRQSKSASNLWEQAKQSGSSDVMPPTIANIGLLNAGGGGVPMPPSVPVPPTFHRTIQQNLTTLANQSTDAPPPPPPPPPSDDRVFTRPAAQVQGLPCIGKPKSPPEKKLKRRHSVGSIVTSLPML
eukprot:PhF_6_TR588/c0_g1_i2/m.648